MKNKLGIKIFIAIFITIIFIANISFASYENVTMTVLTEPVATVNFTENSYFEKKMISKDLNKKEVTMRLKSFK